MGKYGKWIIIGVIVLFIFWIFGGYNGMVSSREEVANQWGNVESAYQRRADLIPNLVNTVKGNAEFERGTLTEVIEARAKATSVNVDANNLSPAAISQFQQAQEGLSGALSRLLVTVERYPELKANQAFQNLQAQLEDTENRINVARNRYNESVRGYNTQIKSFPQVIVASMFGFDEAGYFKADAGSEKAPEVQF